MKMPVYIRLNGVAVVAVLVIICSVFYSGIMKPIGARDIDARYFYVAARCWALGESPYDALHYNARYRTVFDSEPDGPFAAYLPTLMPAILPLAPWTWPAAAQLLEAMNFSAAMFVVWAGYRLVRDLYGEPLQHIHWAWLTLGMTIGGISATISTGQTSLLITAACACALLGCRTHNRFMVIVGTVVASAKPSLSAPLLIFIFLFVPKQRKSIVIAGGIIMAFIGYAAVLDGDLAAHYMDGISVYNATPNNDPRAQIGLGAILTRIALTPRAIQMLSLAALAISLTLAGILYRKGEAGQRESALALILVFFSTGILHTIHGYDVCIFAMGISLYPLLSHRMQLIFLAPTLLLWRPTLLSRAIPALNEDALSNLAWLFTLAACIYGACRMMTVRSVVTD